ncbi:MAG: coiled coil domain-containing protein [Candidatus Hydrogenedentota bacterium]
MDKKDAYEARMQAQLEELKADIAKMRAQAERLAAEARIKQQEEIEELESRRHALERKLKEVREAGTDAWETLRGGVDSAWDELKRSWDEAAKRLLGR